jgi:hypothetical protein
VGRVDEGFHPAVDVLAVADFPLAHMRLMAEPLQPTSEQERPGAIATRVANENFHVSPLISGVVYPQLTPE